jgi:hypothetical protein
LIQTAIILSSAVTTTPAHEGIGEGNHQNKTQLKLTYSLLDNEPLKSTGSFSFRFSVDGTIWSDWYVDIVRTPTVGFDRVSYFDIGDNLPYVSMSYMGYDAANDYALVNNIPKKFQISLNKADNTFINIQKLKLFSRPHCSEDDLIEIFKINFSYLEGWPTEGATQQGNCYKDHIDKRALYLSNIASETGCTEIEITGKTLTVERLTFWNF